MSLKLQISTSGLKLEGLRELRKQYPERLQEVIQRFVDSTKRGVEDLINNSTPTGRMYTIRGVQHQASAPGEPPAIWTGTLVGSIRSRVGKLSGSVGTNTRYARFLEQGTRRMQPRPYLGPVFEEQVERLKADIQRELFR